MNHLSMCVQHFPQFLDLVERPSGNFCGVGRITVVILRIRKAESAGGRMKQLCSVKRSNSRGESSEKNGRPVAMQSI
jgi:hypothetical protein